VVPRKPSDVSPVEMTGTLFGSARPKQPEAPKGFRGWLAKIEQRFIGLPWKRITQIASVVVVVVGGGVLWQSKAVVVEAVTAYVAEATGAVVERIVVSGAVYTGKDDLQTALGLKKGDSLVGFDASNARTRIELLPWVRLASVDRMLPDRVNVTIYEHVPLARLVADGQIFVINKDGDRIVADTNNTFPGLPLLQGNGAAENAGDLFAHLSNWPQLLSQLREAEWVGGRRWDLRFVSGVIVQLPERTRDFGAEQALPLLAKLEEARHVLTLNAGEVDLRLPDRVVLRLPEEVGATPVTNRPATGLKG
jgi:cell division protein FtsQ